MPSVASVLGENGSVLDSDALIAGALFAGLVVLALLVADAVIATLDARRVSDEDAPGADLGRRGLRDLGWSVAVTAALAVVAGFAVDSAVRLIWGDSPVAGALVLLATTVVAFLVGLAAVVAVVRRERPSYARIRRDLRDRPTNSVEPDELEAFAARLEAADLAREKRSQRALPLRLAGVLVILALTVLVGVVGPTGLLIAFLIGSLLAIAAFVVSARAAVVRQEALDAVLEAQRAEVVALLERARIPQRGRVPGLRERVSRALAILREQQK